jgi:hypothetical protein
LVKKPIIFVLVAEERIENMSNGNARPIPNDKKFSMFPKKLAVVVVRVFVKKAAISPGLHGKTIAPKKNPNRKALSKGFFVLGVFSCGMYLLKSKLNIKKILIIASIMKAIGETIFITLVSETFSIVVNTKPSSIMNRITPRVTVSPIIIGVFLSALAESLLERYDKKAGYKGKTQTAVNGVNSPSKKEVDRSARKLTILAPCYLFF